MCGHVIDELAADIDPAAIADAFEIFLAGQQHGESVAGRRAKIKPTPGSIGSAAAISVVGLNVRSTPCRHLDRCLD
jgi:hypothetical protein